MSPDHRGQYGGGGFPFVDNSEKARLAYWRAYSEPISAELLKITGWLSEAPERPILARVGGKDLQLRAGDNPPNVLFRLPEDPEGRKRWESYIHFLRLHQSRLLLMRRLVAEQRAQVKRAEGDQSKLRDDLFEEVELAKFSGKRLRQIYALQKPRPVAEERAAATELASLRERIERCREIVSAYRSAARRATDATRSIANLEERLANVVYPGIWSEINAFLDMQCLSTASMASDEFRKQTPHSEPPRRGPIQEVLENGI